MSNLLNTQKVKDWFKAQLSQIRTGRINAGILDKVKVEAWGSQLSVQEVATIKIPEPGQILLTPFDKQILNDLEKAIIQADLGVNPVNDGAGLRLNFPPLTEENRKERAKKVNQILEEARISLRSERQHILKDLKKQKEEGELSEDELQRMEKEIQDDIDKGNKDLESMAKEKTDEIMKI